MNDTAEETETTITAIFAEVLPVAAATPNTDFFVAGGDSLKAAQIISRLVDAFGVDIGIADFFENPSISGMQTLVSNAPASPSDELQAQLAGLSDDDLLALLDSTD